MKTRNTLIIVMLTVWALLASAGWALQKETVTRLKEEIKQSTYNFGTLSKGKDYYVNPRVDKEGYQFCDIVRLTATVGYAEVGAKPKFLLTHIRGQTTEQHYCWNDFETAVNNDRQ